MHRCSVRMVSIGLTRGGQWSGELNGPQMAGVFLCGFDRKASVGLQRKFRATESSRHVLEAAANDALENISFSETVWSFISPARRTVTFENESFSLVSCIRCVMTDAMYEVHDSFPIAAFEWLEHPDGLGAAVAAEPCHRRFDLFTKTFVRYWSTDGRSLDSAQRICESTPNRVIVIIIYNLTKPIYQSNEKLFFCFTRLLWRIASDLLSYVNSHIHVNWYTI